MMIDLRIDYKTGKFVIGDTTNGKNMVRQWVVSMLKTQMGEYFLDTTFGMPYLESINIKNPQAAQIKTITRRKVESIPAVKKVEYVGIKVDRDARIGYIQINGIETSEGRIGSVEV